jgi:iron(III) transport system ATP-binding protein
VTPNVIELTGITVVQGAARVLDDVSLAVLAGEIVVLSGPSGAGKTTLLRVLAGLAAPAAGTVRLRGRAVSADRRTIIAPEERNLAMVFQDLALWPHLTVQGNLAFALESRGIERDLRESRIHDALSHVGLADHLRRYPGELSGGERQRVAIARALVQEPQAVLFDEPLSNLDVVLKRELTELFRRLLRERRMPALYVTHDPREAAALADRVAILEGGRIVQVGTMAELAASPATAFVRAFAEATPAG